jgi:transposase
MRKTICTPKLTQEITTNIIAGLSNHDAAVSAGIGERTFYAWLSRGEAEMIRLKENGRRKMRKREEPFVQFMQAVKKAKSLRKRTLLAQIQQAARGGAEYTETKRTFRLQNGTLVMVEEITANKERAPVWQAAAWLLERIHPDEFGRRNRIDVYDWREEARKDGYDPDEIIDALAAEFESAMVGARESGSVEEGEATDAASE